MQDQKPINYRRAIMLRAALIVINLHAVELVELSIQKLWHMENILNNRIGIIEWFFFSSFE